jgi:hypothetical protein
MSVSFQETVFPNAGTCRAGRASSRLVKGNRRKKEELQEYYSGAKSQYCRKPSQNSTSAAASLAQLAN